MKGRLAIRLALFAVSGPGLAACGPATTSWAAGLPAASTTREVVRPQSSAHGDAEQLRANPAVIGLALSGTGAGFAPPESPTDKPYSPDCHALIDPGFTGKCVVTVAPTGTIAGVVEREASAGGRVEGPGQPTKRAPGHAHSPAAAKRSAAGAQERDLVWRRQGSSWALVLVHVFQNAGLPSLVWADDIERDHDPKLVLVTPSGRAGFGTELDLVEGTGDVVLYRFLGQGFANVPEAGGLVTYVPWWTQQRGPAHAYDQTLIGYSSGSWRVFSEQFVPDSSALRQHRGAFWDSRAVPAS
jgi:hypothetical protein